MQVRNIGMWERRPPLIKKCTTIPATEINRSGERRMGEGWRRLGDYFHKLSAARATVGAD